MLDEPKQVRQLESQLMHVLSEALQYLFEGHYGEQTWVEEFKIIIPLQVLHSWSEGPKQEAQDELQLKHSLGEEDLN